MQCVVIPSRAGTKNKGLWSLSGQPLVKWVLEEVAEKFPTIVTSDQDDVEILSDEYGAWFVRRPGNLSEDGPGQLERSIAHACDLHKLDDSDVVHICQPTSPFIDSNLLRRAGEMINIGEANSVQSVTRVPHNFHEWNQRIFGERVSFVNEQRRREARNHQDKPDRWAFGNFVSVKYGLLKTLNWPFPNPSLGIEVNRFDSLDVDTKEDLLLAEIYVMARLVRNPFA